MRLSPIQKIFAVFTAQGEYKQAFGSCGVPSVKNPTWSRHVEGGKQHEIAEVSPSRQIRAYLRIRRHDQKRSVGATYSLGCSLRVSNSPASVVMVMLLISGACLLADVLTDELAASPTFSRAQAPVVHRSC